MTETNTIEIEIKRHHREDQEIEIPVKVTIEYPTDHALYAVQAMFEVEKNAENFLKVFAKNGDKSVHEWMQDEGLTLEVPEDE